MFLQQKVCVLNPEEIEIIQINRENVYGPVGTIKCGSHMMALVMQSDVKLVQSIVNP